MCSRTQKSILLIRSTETMKNNSITIHHGWLEQAIKIPSENKNNRPEIGVIKLIVIHSISLPPNTFGGNYIDLFFTNKLDSNAHPYFKEIHQLQVSSHLLIRRNGDITQYVPFHERAWHAGKSNYKGQENCNDYSIGIELEGADHIPYTTAQYQQLASCCEALFAEYPTLSTETIAGHCDIAPGRKTDPGESFDWSLFRALLTP